MRIGIDAREICGRPTGVGRYLAGLLLQWAADPPPHEFVLYAPEPTTLPLDGRRFATRVVAGHPGTWWEQVAALRAARADHVDVWFAPAYTAPLGLQVPSVVAIHDVSFASHPEWFRIREGARRRWFARRAAHRAEAVVTISEFSRRELVEHLGVPERQIHVIPPGIATSASATTVSVAHPAPRTPHLALHVLFVGSIFNRRHVVDLIRAFAPIARAHADVALDIVGDNRTYPRQDPRATIAAEGVGDRVRWHEYVSDTALNDLYSGARAFAFLSEYEGLGLTPLEALSAGVPPVLLDTPVARESCGDAAVYAGDCSLNTITAALESALFDEDVRARILGAAPAQLAKYQWPRAAADTLRVIECAARS